MECTRCGRVNAAGSNFCSHCGERLVADVTLTGDATSIIPAVTDDGGELDEFSPEVHVAVSSLPVDHALLVVERGPDAGARYLLDQDVITVGRHPDSDIFLDDITVSRHHVKFNRTAEGWQVADQNSLNGTYVNRTLVDGEAPLRQGDEVQIGKFRMVFFASGDGLN